MLKTTLALSLAVLVASTGLSHGAGNIVLQIPPKPKPIYIPIDLPKPKPQIIPTEPIRTPIKFPKIPGGGTPGPDSGDKTPGGTKTAAGMLSDFEMRLDCTVKSPDGAPTDDLWIVNVGEADLPEGLKVRFRVPASSDHGAFLLPRAVPVGKKLLVAGQLNEAPSGAPCRAAIIDEAGN